MSGLTGRMLLDKKPSWNLTCFLSTSNSQLLGKEILHLSLIVVPEDFYASHSVPTTQVHSHRGPNTTSWEYPGRRAKPGCTLGLKRKHLVTWKGVNRECPDPSTSCSPLQHGTNSCTTGLIPKYTLESTNCTPVSIHLEAVLITSQEFWKWRAESEVFTTKSPPGLTQLPKKERGSDGWNSCHTFHWVEEREAPTAHTLQDRSSLSVILRIGL